MGSDIIAFNYILWFTDCLPADVLLTIFKYLDQRSLGRVAQVSAFTSFYKSSMYSLKESEDSNVEPILKWRAMVPYIRARRDGTVFIWQQQNLCCGSGSGGSVVLWPPEFGSVILKNESGPGSLLRVFIKLSKESGKRYKNFFTKQYHKFLLNGHKNVQMVSETGRICYYWPLGSVYLRIDNTERNNIFYNSHTRGRVYDNFNMEHVNLKENFQIRIATVPYRFVQ